MQNNLKETIYSSKFLPNGILSFYKNIIQDFVKGHSLGKQLFLRDIKALYRQSFLGVFWAFVPSIVTAMLWIFLNGSKVISVTAPGISFPLFVITGTLIWQTLIQSINTPMASINSGKSLLTKLNFPRESLLIHAFYTIAFNIGILFLVTSSIALFLDWRPTISFLWFPLVLVNVLIVGFSLGLLFHSIFSLIADFSKFLPLALQTLMYVSAVIFPFPKSSGVATMIFNLNPLTHVVIFARSVFIGGPVTHATGFIIVSAFSFLLLGIGLLSYRITMPILIERMGS